MRRKYTVTFTAETVIYVDGENEEECESKFREEFDSKTHKIEYIDVDIITVKDMRNIRKIK